SPLMPVTNGRMVTAVSNTVYSNTCNRVNGTPCVTGSMGIPTLAYSSLRAIASAQKCGGVHTNTMRNSSSASGSTEFVTAAQPSTGGAAPAAPPMTIFCEVARLSHTV